MNSIKSKQEPNITAKVVGVINVTPDSFSDGGKFIDPRTAADRALQMLDEGADWIEFGAESTAPGRTKIDSASELARLLPVLDRLSPDVLKRVSVDTYKSETAKACLSRGIAIINDVSALRYDARMADQIREFKCKIVLMYSKERGDHPHATRATEHLGDPITEIKAFLTKQVDYALQCGIEAQQIILDSGMGGFISSEPSCSWSVLAEYKLLTEDPKLGAYPFMIATSRKGFLSTVKSGADTEMRDSLSQLTALVAVLRGASFVRTHNPLMMRLFLNVWNKLF